MNRPWKCLKSKTGASTVHYVLVFMCFTFLLAGVMKVFVEIHKANTAMRTASEASQMLLSYYDDHLKDDYGLLAYQNDKARNEQLLAGIQAQKKEISVVHALSQLSEFQNQAIALGAIEAIEDAGRFIGGKTFDEKTLEEANTQKQKQADQKTELDKSLQSDKDDLGEGSAQYDLERAKKIKKMIKTFVAKPLDNTQGSELIIPRELLLNRYEFIRETARKLTAAERAEMVYYLFSRFNHRLSGSLPKGVGSKASAIIEKRKGILEKGEIEYILTGNPSQREAQRQVAQKIFLLREPLNLVHLLSSKTKMEEIQLLTSATTAWFPLSAPLVEAGIIGVWTSIESYADVKRLLEGKAIPWIKKNDSEWYTSIENQLNERESDAKSENRDKQMGDSDYADCLFVLLLSQEDGQTALRAMNLIDMNLSFAYSDKLNWSQMVTAHEIKFSLNGHQWRTFTQGYLPQENKSDEK